MNPICPVNGRECPGPENCAPAVFSVYIDEKGASHYRCPISATTDTLQAMLFCMEPVMANIIGPPKQPSIDEVGREKFLQDVVKPEARADQ